MTWHVCGHAMEAAVVAVVEPRVGVVAVVAVVVVAVVVVAVGVGDTMNDSGVGMRSAIVVTRPHSHNIRIG